MIGNVWEWTADWYQAHADTSHACCTVENPRGGERERSIDPPRPGPGGAPGDEGRLAPVRPELLPPLPPRRSHGPAGGHLHEPPRLPPGRPSRLTGSCGRDPRHDRGKDSRRSRTVPDKPNMPTDLLPSWRDTPTRAAIVDFVAAAQQLPPAERVAAFDNDGTLWTRRCRCRSRPTSSSAGWPSRRRPTRRLWTDSHGRPWSSRTTRGSLVRSPSTTRATTPI